LFFLGVWWVVFDTPPHTRSPRSTAEVLLN
jgi:hypothetical protein